MASHTIQAVSPLAASLTPSMHPGMGPVILVKAGGAAITHKNAASPSVCWPRVWTAVQLIAALRAAGAVPVLVHGAGSFGHAHAKAWGLASPQSSDEPADAAQRRMAAVLTHSVVKQLSDHMVHACMQLGIPAVSVPAMPLPITTHGGRQQLSPGSLDAVLACITPMLQAGYVPVLHGDAVRDLDAAWDSSILSGDTLLWQLAAPLRARAIVLLSDVPCLFTACPTAAQKLAPCGCALQSSASAELTSPATPPTVSQATRIAQVLVAPGTSATDFHIERMLQSDGSACTMQTASEATAAAVPDVTGGVQSKLESAALAALACSPPAVTSIIGCDTESTRAWFSAVLGEEACAWPSLPASLKVHSSAANPACCPPGPLHDVPYIAPAVGSAALHSRLWQAAKDTTALAASTPGTHVSIAQ